MHKENRSTIRGHGATRARTTIYSLRGDVYLTRVYEDADGDGDEVHDEEQNEA